MYRRQLLTLLSLFVVVLMTVQIVSGQDGLITYTTYDGYLSFDLPAGWAADRRNDENGLYFFNLVSDDSMLQRDGDVDDPEAGQMRGLVMRWQYLMKTYGVGLPGDTPENVLQTAFGDQMESLDITLETTTVGAYPAAKFEAEDDTNAGSVYALDMGIGGINLFVFSALTRPDYEALEPDLLALMASVEFGGGAVVHFSPTGFWALRQVWGPDSQSYATVAMYPLTGNPISAALYRPTGELIAQNEGMGVTWNADGSRAILYGDPQSSAALVMEVSSGEELLALGSAAKRVQWSPDERLIFSGDLGEFFKIWDAETQLQIASMMPPAQYWALNADQSLLATWDYGGSSVTVWDMLAAPSTRGTQLWTADRASSYFDAALSTRPEVSWSPDGESLLIITRDEVPALLDGRTGETRFTYTPPEGMELDDAGWDEYALTIGFKTVDCRIGSCIGELWVVDPVSGEVRVQLPHAHPVGNVVWNADGGQLATITDFEATIVTLWDGESGEALWETPVEVPDTGVRLYPAGESRLVVSNRGEVVPLLDAADGSLIHLNPQQADVEGSSLSADGSRLLIWGGPIVRVRSTEDGSQILALPHEAEEVLSARWSADESLIYTTTPGGSFQVWEVSSGRRLVTLLERVSIVDADRSVAASVSPDGQYVLIRSENNPYQRLWSLEPLLESARAAIAAETDRVDDLITTLNTALNDGDAEALAEPARRLIELDPDEGYGYTMLGVSFYYAEEDFEEAERLLKLALTINPEHIPAYRYLGDIYRREGDYAEARALFETALALSDNDEGRAFFHNRIGLTYSRDEATLVEATEAFTRAIELMPEFPLYYNNRGYMYYNRGEAFYPEAIADFERYVELAGENADPDTVELLNTLRGD